MNEKKKNRWKNDKNETLKSSVEDRLNLRIVMKCTNKKNPGKFGRHMVCLTQRVSEEWQVNVYEKKTKQFTFGRKNTDGTESIDTTTSTSAEQPSFSEKINILASGGSSGNSTILRPSAVSPPVLSKAPRIHSWYRDDWILSYNDVIITAPGQSI